VLDDAMGLEPDGGPTWPALWTSENGTLAYLPGPVRQKRELAWVDRTGTPESSRARPRIGLVFVSTRKGDYDTIVANADGSNERPLLVEDFDESPGAWTKDGRLLIREWRHDGSRPVILVTPGNGATPRTVVAGNIGTKFVRLSPEERWLAYDSDVSGRLEVYVQPFPEGGPAVRISNGGGEPQWSRTTNEVFFRRGDALVSVPFRVEAGRFVPGAETRLFTLPSFQLYGTSLDGRRFLVARRAEPEPTPGIRIVLNWFEELR
jgi:Tol biopolymer transport system component